ncbi:unnamed protein product [Camellia sinensis]
MLQTIAAMDEKQDNPNKLRLLEGLKKASRDLQSIPIPLCSKTNLSTITTFLQLLTQLDSFLSTDPTLFNLSQSLSNLKTQLNNLQNSQDYCLISFIHRQIANYEISKIASTIEAQIQAWIDQESIKNLVRVLVEDVGDDEEEKVKVLIQFEDRLSNGFDRDLQEMILKSKMFFILESVVSKSKCSKRVCEESARAIAALVRFNKDVFVGQVLMGPTIEALISISSYGSIQVLTSLVNLIRSPLVYEMESNGYILRIISLLMSSNDLLIQSAAMECVLEIVHFARKEAIEAMLEEGLIKKLVDLQRLGIERELIELSEFDEDENRGNSEETESEAKIGIEERGLMENWPFTSCVTRFVVQFEMGEGLEKGEKRQLKQEILRRVREASVSEAEATSIVAEVLWGSSPLLH